MNVVVDTREPDSIHRLFSGEAGYESKELPVGDVFLPQINVLIERKEYADFVQSIYAGHMEKQLMQMSATPFTRIVVIVGDIKKFQFENRSRFFKSSERPPPTAKWTLGHQLGFFASKLNDYPSIHFVQLENNHQLKTFVEKLVMKFSDVGKGGIDATELMRAAKLEVKSQADIQTRMLTGIPDIGVATARAILKHAGTLEKLMVMSVEDLQDIPDIGEKTAKVIYAALH